jgi:hypothetical protein
MRPLLYFAHFEFCRLFLFIPAFVVLLPVAAVALGRRRGDGQKSQACRIDFGSELALVQSCKKQRKDCCVFWTVGFPKLTMCDFLDRLGVS